MNKTIAAVAATLTAFALSACAEPTGRTGTGPDPVTLKAPEAASDALLGKLATDTAGAAVRVTLTPAATNDGTEDTVTLDRLKSGLFDIALVRAGRLEEEGARSLAPLGTPFLVTNDDQAKRIAADPRAADLLAGLPDIGLVGIGLVPVGVRHPFGYTTPLLGAADYAGKTINNRVDETSTKILRALGANVDHSANEERASKVKAGALRGIEASLQTFGAVELPAVLTSNVDLYARFDVIVVRKATWEALTASQRDALKASVAKASSASIAATRSEEAAMAEWCMLPGASAVTATDAELATLHAKLDPIVEQITAKHRSSVDWMRALRQGTTDPVLACGDAAGNDPDATPPIQPVGNQHVLDGRWRTGGTPAELEAAGVTPSDAIGNAGIWELDIDGASAHVRLPDRATCEWTFTFAGNRVLVDLGTDSHCGGKMFGTWSRSGDVVTFVWENPKPKDPDAVYLNKLGMALFGRFVKVQGG